MSKRKRQQVKRSVLIEGLGDVLDIAVATKVNLRDKGDQFIHLDQMKDGRWRLVWTDGVVHDWSEVVSLKMLREGPDAE